MSASDCFWTDMVLAAESCGDTTSFLHTDALINFQDRTWTIRLLADMTCNATCTAQEVLAPAMTAIARGTVQLWANRQSAVSAPLLDSQASASCRPCQLLRRCYGTDGDVDKPDYTYSLSTLALQPTDTPGVFTTTLAEIRAAAGVPESLVGIFNVDFLVTDENGEVYAGPGGLVAYL